VNLDHVRITPGPYVATGATERTCRRGHEISPATVVRHRDGRIAYCRICRNERRRERYRTDPMFALSEIERQRNRRR
jgi:hypothetical protein